MLADGAGSSGAETLDSSSTPCVDRRSDKSELMAWMRRTWGPEDARYGRSYSSRATVHQGSYEDRTIERTWSATKGAAAVLASEAAGTAAVETTTMSAPLPTCCCPWSAG